MIEAHFSTSLVFCFTHSVLCCGCCAASTFFLNSSYSTHSFPFLVLSAVVQKNGSEEGFDSSYFHSWFYDLFMRRLKDPRSGSQQSIHLFISLLLTAAAVPSLSSFPLSHHQQQLCLLLVGSEQHTSSAVKKKNTSRSRGKNYILKTAGELLCWSVLNRYFHRAAAAETKTYSSRGHAK